MTLSGPDTGLAALLERCAAADRAAFRALYDLQAPRLYAIAIRITRQPGTAADAVQEAFLQVWQNARHYRPERGSAQAWLIGLVRYRALDIVRRKAPDTYGLAPEDSMEFSTSLDPLVESGEGEALYRCLEQLEPDRRQLVVAAFVDGYSHSELSTRFSLPLGTVKSWIRRSLDGLRECLGT